MSELLVSIALTKPEHNSAGRMFSKSKWLYQETLSWDMGAVTLSILIVNNIRNYRSSAFTPKIGSPRD